LVNEVAAPENLAERSLALARQLAAKSPLTLSIGKAAFYRQEEMGLEAAYTYATQVMIDNMAAEDAQEGISAFLDKRPPVWRGR
jgi:enoyl-CoA hydratase/carnithine racemase